MMDYRWIGAFLILLGCGSCGFSIASQHRKEEQNLHQLLRVLQYMKNELEYRLTPLPELCRGGAEEASGMLSFVFSQLADLLDTQAAPDANSCMQMVLRENDILSRRMRKILIRLGNTLGRFDLPGQLRGLNAIEAMCKDSLVTLSKNRDTRLRSYQTLGLCAGAAMVIIFL